MRTIGTVVGVGVLCLVLAACSPGGPMNAPTPAGPSPRPSFQTTAPGPVGPSGSATEVPPVRWAAIRADLTARGITEEPVLVSAERLTFNDGSLGCPSPGQSYTQARVEGMRVVVTAAGATYDYRFGDGDAPRLCSR